MRWKTARYAGIGPASKLPTPKRVDVVEWLNEVWNNFQSDIVRNSFRGSGYYYDTNVDYSMETESESEASSSEE